MIMLQIIAQALGLILGSLLAGILLWWLSFSLSKLCRHPKWGMPIVAPVLLMAFGHDIYQNEFLGLTLMFAILISGLLWAVGDGWEHADSGPVKSLELAKTSSSVRKAETEQFRYSAIAACMSECRSPSQAEIRKLAKRIRSETYPGQRLDPTLCRRILRAALAALDGRAGIDNGRAAYPHPENRSNTIITGGILASPVGRPASSDRGDMSVR